MTEQVRQPTVRLTRNVAELRRRLGTRTDVDIDIVLPRLEVIASRTTDAPVIGSVTIDSIERGVTVTGSVTFHWEGDCRRCLEPVSGSIDVDIMEIFQVGAPDSEEDIRELENDTVDLVPVIRDAVALALPLAPLCRDDCSGPDPDRYPAKTAVEVERELAAKPPAGDPRWAALSELDLEDPGAGSD